MLSSKSMNKLFNSLAKFVSQLTGRVIEFQQITQHELMDTAYEKMNRFFESASEVLDNPTVQMLGTLEPGKIYCIQIDFATANVEVLLQTIDSIAAMGDIKVVVIDQGVNFVKVPEGYEVVKKE